MRILLCLLAAALVLDTALFSRTSHFTAGLVMLYLVTLASALAAVFYPWLETFCAAPVGRVLLWIVLAGMTVYFLLALFLAAGVWKKADGREKFLIVLGAGLVKDVPNTTLRCRLDAAWRYYQSNPRVILVTSGGRGPEETRPEGDAMKDYLVAKGIPPQKILSEPASQSTRENFVFSRQLLRQAGYEIPDGSLAYVTNRFHCYRAGCCARRAGFSGAGAVCAPIGPVAVLPCYLREVLAVCHLWIFA